MLHRYYKREFYFLCVTSQLEQQKKVIQDE